MASSLLLLILILMLVSVAVAPHVALSPTPTIPWAEELAGGSQTAAAAVAAATAAAASWLASTLLTLTRTAASATFAAAPTATWVIPTLLTVARNATAVASLVSAVSTVSQETGRAVPTDDTNSPATGSSPLVDFKGTCGAGGREASKIWKVIAPTFFSLLSSFVGLGDAKKSSPRTKLALLILTSCAWVVDFGMQFLDWFCATESERTLAVVSWVLNACSRAFQVWVALVKYWGELKKDKAKKLEAEKKQHQEQQRQAGQEHEAGQAVPDPGRTESEGELTQSEGFAGEWWESRERRESWSSALGEQGERWEVAQSAPLSEDEQEQRRRHAGQFVY